MSIDYNANNRHRLFACFIMMVAIGISLPCSIQAGQVTDGQREMVLKAKQCSDNGDEACAIKWYEKFLDQYGNSVDADIVAGVSMLAANAYWSRLTQLTDQGATDRKSLKILLQGAKRGIELNNQSATPSQFSELSFHVWAMVSAAELGDNAGARGF